MLDGQRQLLAVATRIEVAVAPGVEFGGAAQGLAGTDADNFLPSRSTLSGDGATGGGFAASRASRGFN